MKSLIPPLCTIFVITTIVGIIEARETPLRISKALIPRRSDKVFILAKRSISENHNEDSHADSVEEDVDASRKIRQPPSSAENSDEAPMPTTKPPSKKKGKGGESGGGGFPGYHYPGYLPMTYPGVYPGVYPGYPVMGHGYGNGYVTPKPDADSENITEKPDKSKKQKPEQKQPNYFTGYYAPYAHHYGAYPHFG